MCQQKMYRSVTIEVAVAAGAMSVPLFALDSFLSANKGNCIVKRIEVNAGDAIQSISPISGATLVPQAQAYNGGALILKDGTTTLIDNLALRRLDPDLYSYPIGDLTPDAERIDFAQSKIVWGSAATIVTPGVILFTVYYELLNG